MFIKKEELKEIKTKLTELEAKQEILKDTIKFLGQHNRDEIATNTNDLGDFEETYFLGSLYYLTIRYFDSYGMYKTKQTSMPRSMKIEDVEKVDNDIYVLHFKDTIEDEDLRTKDKFLQLNRRTNEILDITDIKARYENQEKVSAHLKESAQALSEVVKDFFKAQDTHQKLNEKTTIAKKTKKNTKK